ncbi:low-density lipoprotein receptor domain containing lost and found [Arctopsyche grandis]|uniref:low-density lipoprotein receptor domain containing lost and found n=1 Tax=Arctopsyche grandis TaxID=121162 RepID=UPI00406D83F1
MFEHLAVHGMRNICLQHNISRLTSSLIVLPPDRTVLYQMAYIPRAIRLLSVIVAAESECDIFHLNYMQSLCKNHFLQQLYRKIDGAVLWSQNERNLDCVITFQTHSILQRFMLRFDMLQLDCNDHLLVYDGAHAVGTHKADLSCRNTKQTVGALFTRTNFVTLKYVTDNWGTESNGFKLVITAVKDPKHGCKDFRCSHREFCISADLICDGVNHCVDGSDETSSTLCQNQESGNILGLELPWLVVGGVSALLVVCACVAALALCLCRRTRPNHADNPQLQPDVRVKRLCGKAGRAAATDRAAGKLAAPCGAGRGAAGAPPQAPGRALRPAAAPAAPHKDEWFV